MLSTKMIYAPDGTIERAASYPINYTETASAMAWAQPAFTGQQFAGTVSALLRAYAKVLGDVDGDFNVNIVDFSAVAYAHGSRPGGAGSNPNADFDNDGVIGIADLSIVAYYYGASS